MKSFIQYALLVQMLSFVRGDPQAVITVFSTSYCSHSEDYLLVYADQLQLLQQCILLPFTVRGYSIMDTVYPWTGWQLVLKYVSSLNTPGSDHYFTPGNTYDQCTSTDVKYGWNYVCINNPSAKLTVDGTEGTANNTNDTANNTNDTANNTDVAPGGVATRALSKRYIGQLQGAWFLANSIFYRIETADVATTVVGSLDVLTHAVTEQLVQLVASEYSPINAGYFDAATASVVLDWNSICFSGRCYEASACCSGRLRFRKGVIISNSIGNS